MVIRLGAGKVFRKHSDITTVEIHVWIGTLSGAPDEDLLSDVLPCMLGCLHVVLVTPGRPLLIDLYRRRAANNENRSWIGLALFCLQPLLIKNEVSRELLYLWHTVALVQCKRILLRTAWA